MCCFGACKQNLKEKRTVCVMQVFRLIIKVKLNAVRRSERTRRADVNAARVTYTARCRRALCGDTVVRVYTSSCSDASTCVVDVGAER